MERVLTAKREILAKNDPHWAEKPRFLGESGLITGRVNGDQQPRVKTFEYGVMMADYVAQVGRAGWQGALAWDLDDAMHAVKWAPVPNDLTLKVWGFWNSAGALMGRPQEFTPRPWFYTWSLASRLFPRGCRLIRASHDPVPRLRVLAGLREGRLSVMIVNNDAQPRTVLLKPARDGLRVTQRWVYFDGDRPSDGRGYPVPKGEADWKVELPERGVVFVADGDA
jgi:hypothetical protein